MYRRRVEVSVVGRRRRARTRVGLRSPPHPRGDGGRCPHAAASPCRWRRRRGRRRLLRGPRRRRRRRRPRARTCSARVGARTDVRAAAAGRGPVERAFAFGVGEERRPPGRARSRLLLSSSREKTTFNAVGHEKLVFCRSGSSPRRSVTSRSSTSYGPLKRRVRRRARSHDAAGDGGDGRGGGEGRLADHGGGVSGAKTMTKTKTRSASSRARRAARLCRRRWAARFSPPTAARRCALRGAVSGASGTWPA